MLTTNTYGLSRFLMGLINQTYFSRIVNEYTIDIRS